MANRCGFRCDVSMKSCTSETLQNVRRRKLRPRPSKTLGHAWSLTPASRAQHQLLLTPRPFAGLCTASHAGGCSTSEQSTRGRQHTETCGCRHSSSRTLVRRRHCQGMLPLPCRRHLHHGLHPVTCRACCQQTLSVARTAHGAKRPPAAQPSRRSGAVASTLRLPPGKRCRSRR